jgi:hypothetical protein
MVAVRDIDRGPQKRYWRKQFKSDLRMPFHYYPFFFCKFPRLKEDAIRHPQLADIMEKRTSAYTAGDD